MDTIVFLDTVQQNRNAIVKLALTHGASDVRVFGSVARGDDNQDSDVDFLVSFPPRYDMFSQHITLASELTDLLGRTVNLITMPLMR